MSNKNFPYISISRETTLTNKTGSWRTQRPEYQRGIAPCQANCLSGQDIPRWLQAFKNGNLETAYRLILESNPFPAITGRVCPHPCEKECNRGHFDAPLAINLLERFLGDWGLENVSLEVPAISQKKRVAIIGSGPAGLSGAFYLRQKGYQITIYEALPIIGGLPAYGIPDFRLPKEVVKKEIEKKILVPGIEVRTTTRVSKQLTFQIISSQFEAIFVAVGASKSKDSKLPGKDALGVSEGIEFLKNVSLGARPRLGHRVIVIGGGNTAIDAARMAKRLAPEVLILYRRTRTEMPAIREEILAAEKEGIEIQELIMPVRIITNKAGWVDSIECQRMRLAGYDESGRQKPIPIEGTNFQIAANSVILAIGEEPDFSFLPEDWQSQEKIFVGGDFDLSAGPAERGTVAGAIKSGREKAMMIDRYLRGEPSSPQNIEQKIIRFEDLNHHYFQPQLRVRQLGESCPEIIARSEAKRCFSCGFCNLCQNCYKFCPDLAIRKKVDGLEIDYDYCKGCGICVKECPTRSIILKPEVKND